jgi:hypothetical protein
MKCKPSPHALWNGGYLNIQTKHRHRTDGYHLRKPNVTIQVVSLHSLHQCEFNRSGFDPLSVKRETLWIVNLAAGIDVWLHIPLFLLLPRNISKINNLSKLVIVSAFHPHKSFCIVNFWLLGVIDEEITYFKRDHFGEREREWFWINYGVSKRKGVCIHTSYTGGKEYTFLIYKWKFSWSEAGYKIYNQEEEDPKHKTFINKCQVMLACVISIAK